MTLHEGLRRGWAPGRTYRRMARLRMALCALLSLLLLGASGCRESPDSGATPDARPQLESIQDRVVVAALSAIDSTTLPWSFIESFMVNSTMSGFGDPFDGEGEIQDSPLDLLGIQERGFGICTACADSTRFAHAWVTLARPVQDSPSDWIVPYTLSVRRWGSRTGRVTVRCLGGACRPTEGGLDSLDIPTPSCCPVFIRVVRPRR